VSKKVAYIHLKYKPNIKLSNKKTQIKNPNPGIKIRPNWFIIRQKETIKTLLLLK